jgi:putative FmdB family regulatory protein
MKEVVVMPLYEYNCLRCGEKFEKLVSYQEKVKCEKCGGGVKKLMSPFTLQTGKFLKRDMRPLCSKC